MHMDLQSILNVSTFDSLDIFVKNTNLTQYNLVIYYIQPTHANWILHRGQDLHQFAFYQISQNLDPDRSLLASSEVGILGLDIGPGSSPVTRWR